MPRLAQSGPALHASLPSSPPFTIVVPAMSFLSPRPRPADLPAAGYSVLDASLVVTGDLESRGPIRIDGRLHGSVLGADLVIIGSAGTVHGDLAAREIVIAGTVEGNVRAIARIEVQAGANVVGDIEAATVAVAEGAQLSGRMLVRARALEQHDAPADAASPAKALRLR